MQENFALIFSQEAPIYVDIRDLGFNKVNLLRNCTLIRRLRLRLEPQRAMMYYNIWQSKVHKFFDYGKLVSECKEDEFM